MRRQKQGRQNRRYRRRCSRAAIWLLAAVLALTMCAPAETLAVESADPGDPIDAAEPTDPIDAAEPTDPIEAAEPTDPIEAAEPTDPIEAAEPTDPTEPEFRSVFRVKVNDNGRMRCWYYNSKGKRRAEPEKDRYFIVTFDKGSRTEGTAVSKVGKTGTLYYFNKYGKGKKHTGWFKQSGKRYFFRVGKRYKGTKKIRGIWYAFSKKNGQLQRRIGDNLDKKVQKHRSRTRYLIIVRLSWHKVRIYKGRRNAWKRIKNYTCTTGARSTPTIRGTFTVGSKGLYFNTGIAQRCWYYTQFRGNYLFHSVIYDRSSSPRHVVDGRLGISASHGCIRLKLKNAKWIYRHIPRGTKVVIR